jgi:hypothetical protein
LFYILRDILQLMNRITTNAMVVMFILIGIGSGLVFSSAYSQSMGNSSATGNQTTGGNISKGAIGSSSQLNKLLGNNTEVMANNTAIGNPNASTAEKMASESNATTGSSMQPGGGNQSNQTGSSMQPGGGNQSNQTGSSMQPGGGNQSNQTGNQTNPISKALEGIGKAIGIK